MLSSTGSPETARAVTTAVPTRTRYRVVGLVVLLGMVTYLDRVCISKLAPNIMSELGLDKVQMGYVFSAFATAYTIFALPAARWAGRVGTRLALATMVVWWSVFTISTAVAMGFVSLLAIRFLFGAGEAGAWPCIAQTFSRWIPRKERGTAQGIAFTGAHLTGGLTPLLVVWLATFMSWRAIFALFGLVGFVWAAVWYVWFRDEPASHPGVDRSEVEAIQTGHDAAPAAPAVGWAFWKKLLRSPAMLVLCVMYFPNSFVFYFCITWLPTYLHEKHGFDAAQLGFLAGLPLILSVLGDLLGGVTTDRMTARFGPRIGRCGVGGASYLVAAVLLLAVPACHNPVLAAVLIAVAVSATMFMLGAAWSTCLDMGGSHAGVITAAMNTTAQVGTMLCPLIVAYSLKWFNNWNISFYVMGGLLLVSTACWYFVDPRKRVFETTPNPLPSS